MSGINYLFFLPDSIAPSENFQKWAIALAVGGGLAYLGLKSNKALAARTPEKDLIVPEKEPSVFGAVDFVLSSFLNYQDSVLGKENRKYFPFCATLFFFILIANLVGLIPGMPAATTTVWVNVALAFVVFLLFNVFGIKENGLLGYLKHLGGPFWTKYMWPLAIFFFALETLSITLRILTLNLRLYWNIKADHMVLEVFTDMTKLFVPALFYLLGTFVSVMQAFVFVTLTMIYIRIATEHSEEEGHH